MNHSDASCQHDIKHIIDENVYLYSVCGICGDTFRSLSQGLIYNISIMGEESPAVTAYKMAHGDDYRLYRRRDLEK